jgi:murein DD-endopeptidase MepM/ murein hydrolase activator NlpD
VLVELLWAVPAGAVDPKQKQAQLRRDRQAVERKLDAAKASDAKIEAEVARLDAVVRRQQGRASDAVRESLAATARVAEAGRRLAAIESRTRAAREQLIATAVDAYVGRGAGVLRPGDAATRSLSDAARREAYLQLLRGRQRDVIDELRAAKVDELAAKASLEEARQATARRAAAEQEHAELLADARGAQERAQRTMQARIAELQAESRALAAQEAQIQAILRAASRSTGPVSNVGLVWPLRGPVTSEFGSRWGRFHSGMDIAPGAGTPINAAKAGTVVFAGYNGGYGNFVIIDHGGGVATAYAHMSSIAASQGARIGQGGRVGSVGSTGHSTGPHLHYEVRINGAARNPRQYHVGSP